MLLDTEGVTLISTSRRTSSCQHNVYPRPMTMNKRKSTTSSCMNLVIYHVAKLRGMGDHTAKRLKGQVSADKTQRRSCQAPCNSTQELGAPSQPVAEERRTLEHAPYPSKRDCSPA